MCIKIFGIDNIYSVVNLLYKEVVKGFNFQSECSGEPMASLLDHHIFIYPILGNLSEILAFALNIFPQNSFKLTDLLRMTIIPELLSPVKQQYNLIEHHPLL